MLNLYSVFHLNLMYSSIEESDRPEVIEKCYEPLVTLAAITPIGIEAPAVTLEIIKELDSNWILSLTKDISESKIALMGSGYSQIIGPLVPAKVKTWNQKMGLLLYQQLI